MMRTDTKTRDDAFLRFLRVVHGNGLRLHGNLEGGDALLRTDVEEDEPVSLTQVDAARRAGLSRPSVASYARRMRGKVLRKDTLAIRAKTGYAIGVEFGRTHGTRVALSDINGRILKTIPSEGEATPLSKQTPVDALAFAEQKMLEILEFENTRVSVDEVIGVGISLPGPVKDHNLIGPDADLWRHLSPAEELSRRLGGEWEDVPFETQSDTYLSALAENLWGGGDIDDHTLYVKWSSRLRAAIVIDGDLYTGHSGTAGELRHIVVEAAEAAYGETLPKPCSVCGELYCLHAIAALPAISNWISGREDMRAQQIVEHASEDKAALGLLKVAAGGIGEAIAPLIDGLDPEIVVLGGALGSRAFPFVLEDLTTGIGNASVHKEDDVRVRGGRLELRTAVCGAVALALLKFGPTYLRRQVTPH